MRLVMATFRNMQCLCIITPDVIASLGLIPCDSNTFVSSIRRVTCDLEVRHNIDGNIPVHKLRCSHILLENISLLVPDAVSL